MDKLILIIIWIYRKMIDYCMGETKWGFKRAGIALMIPLVAGVIIFKFNETIALKITLSSVAIFGFFCVLMYLNSDTKLVHFISKGKYDRPRQLLKHMTHLSYVYGVIISIDIMSIICLVVFAIEFIFGQKMLRLNIEVMFCIIFFAFSFFYFIFHLYVNPENLEISFIKQRLQLYTALGTTVSFILLIINVDGGVKKFITGILLDYLWINYFIVDKENKLKNQDV